MVGFSSLAVQLLSASSIFLSNVPSAFAEEQQILDAGLDGTLNHIQYGAASEPDPQRALPFKKRLLELITKPDNMKDLHGRHPRYWVLQALFGFSRHGQRYQSDVRKWEHKYDQIPQKHKDIIRKATDYEAIYDQAYERYAINGKVAEEIVQNALKYYDIRQEELTNFISMQEQNENWDAQDRVNEAVQHIVRDWAAEGLHERADAYRSILRTLETHFPDREGRKEGPLKVVVPGSGLGRLAHEIANLGGFEVTANEWSAYMRVAYRYIESLLLPRSVRFHPFMDWWSYQPNRHEMIRGVDFPDSKLNKSSVVLVEGDFNAEFVNHTAHFDAAVTFFFMDTAPNMMDYFDTLSRVIKPGGLWINLGPLLYHEANVEFSLEDMMKVAQAYGFEFIDVDDEYGPLTLENFKARGREIGYMYHHGSMRRNIYYAQLFAAVKKK